MANCRLCLKANQEKYISIFDQQDGDLNVASILSQHFWFEISQDDEYSKSVCTACWYRVESFHVFYIQIYNVHNKLLAKLNDDQIKIEMDEIPVKYKNEILGDENATVMDEKTVEKIEDEIFCENDDLEVGDAHDDDYTQENENSQCNSTQMDAVDVKQEYVNTHSDSSMSQETFVDVKKPDSSHVKLSVERKRRTGSTKTKAKRKRLERDSNNENETEQIERLQHEDDQIREYFIMECDLCPTKFELWQNVKSHYRIVHNMNGYLTCCSRKFNKRCYVLQHIQRHLNPDIFKCDICNKTYLEKRGLQNHMDKHLPNSEKQFKCAKCPKAFGKNFLLRQHQIRHMTDEEKKFVCDECGKSFASNSILQSHKRGVHEGAYVHVCEICAKSFKSKMFYETHMKTVHSDEVRTKVQCQLCGTWLKHEHSLRNHMKRHEDANKEHICSVCGKQSPNRTALKSHQQYVHMIGRAHKCNVCDKAFKKAVALREHMAMHTGEVLYTCPHCPKTFNSSANLHSHRKKMHPKEWEENRRCKSQMSGLDWTRD